MTWIVQSGEDGFVKLVSSSAVDGMLPIGSFLTVKSAKSKFVLRVDKSYQEVPYEPSSLVIDMDLSTIKEDLKSQNIVMAYRVRDLSSRDDGLIDFIEPLSKAERSTSEEINEALKQNDVNGPKIFISTVYSSENKILKDKDQKLVSIKLPEEAFYHQIIITGKTGSGKTAAMKYLSQYFVEELGGSVLAINVKDNDFLRMNIPTQHESPTTLNEWESLGKTKHGIENFSVFYPAASSIPRSELSNSSVYRKVTFDIKNIEAEAFTGLLNNITDTAAQNLPSIFRYWRDEQMKKSPEEVTFKEFTNFIISRRKERSYPAKNSKGEILDEIPIHAGTIENIIRNLNYASDFFDNNDATSLSAGDILQSGKMSVIDIADVDHGFTFGSILLRDLLHRIVEVKKAKKYEVPVLIVIDEVHQFYGSDSSKEALGDLDTISRTGRSQKIGVIFASQNPGDMPAGLSNVINTKFMFRSEDSQGMSKLIPLGKEEMASLGQGFCAAMIHNLSQVRTVKFPLPYAGIFREGDEKDE
jgi:DNA helicase HerA-like ATPase